MAWSGFSFGLLKSANVVGRTLQVIRNQSADAVSVAEPAPVPAAINLPALDSRNAELVVIDQRHTAKPVKWAGYGMATAWFWTSPD